MSETADREYPAIMIEVPHQSPAKAYVVDDYAQLRHICELSAGDNWEWPGHWDGDPDDPKANWIDDTTVDDCLEAFGHDMNSTVVVFGKAEALAELARREEMHRNPDPKKRAPGHQGYRVLRLLRQECENLGWVVSAEERSEAIYAEVWKCIQPGNQQNCVWWDGETAFAGLTGVRPGDPDAVAVFENITLDQFCPDDTPDDEDEFIAMCMDCFGEIEILGKTYTTRLYGAPYCDGPDGINGGECYEDTSDPLALAKKTLNAGQRMDCFAADDVEQKIPVRRFVWSLEGVHEVNI